LNYERIAAGLQKKISDIVARYEGDLAILQEQATQEIEQRDAKIAELEAQLEALNVEKEDVKSTN
jgi:hypothetical protein